MNSNLISIGMGIIVGGLAVNWYHRLKGKSTFPFAETIGIILIILGSL